MTTTYKLLLRIHDSGDFFSPWYMRALLSAVGKRPWIQAYGYTKRIDLLAGMALPDNVKLLQSVGGRLDDRIDRDQPHARVFLTEQARIEAGYQDGNESDLPAVRGESVGLVYHGTETPIGVDSDDWKEEAYTRGGITQVRAVNQYGTRSHWWEVQVPTGIKRRKLHVHRFNLIDIPDAGLGKLITIRTGNAKVKKTAGKMSTGGVRYVAGAINLPALASCPMAGACALFCYALQGSFAFKSVRESRARTWAVLHEAYRRGGEDMVARVIGDALDAAAPRGVKVAA